MAAMSYLDLARSVLIDRDNSEESPSQRIRGPGDDAVEGEKSEGSEKRYALDAGWMTPDEAEQLKRQIIAAVTFEPERFGRERYEALLARWNAHEAAMTNQADEEQVA
jgi:hypothetical protein